MRQTKPAIIEDSPIGTHDMTPWAVVNATIPTLAECSGIELELKDEWELGVLEKRDEDFIMFLNILGWSW